jgi:uncharacterized protein YciI
MTLFVLTCLDKPDSLDLRLAVRPQHVAYLEGHRDIMRVAGPLLDDAGAPMGSVLLLEAPDREAAAAFAAEDPYAKAGLFESVTLRPWRITIGALA